MQHPARVVTQRTIGSDRRDKNKLNRNDLCRVVKAEADRRAPDSS